MAFVVLLLLCWCCWWTLLSWLVVLVWELLCWDTKEDADEESNEVHEALREDDYDEPGRLDDAVDDEDDTGCEEEEEPVVVGRFRRAPTMAASPLANNRATRCAARLVRQD